MGLVWTAKTATTIKKIYFIFLSDSESELEFLNLIETTFEGG